MSYYVYVLKRPNGTPFYVGKGTRARMKFHEWAAKKGERSHRANVIRKIWSTGGKVITEKVAEGLDHDDAVAMECELISRYGRITNGGTLVNLTDGGEGAPGYKHDLVDLMKMSEAWKTRGPVSLETRQKISASSKGKTHSEEAKRKLSEVRGPRHWNFGGRLSEEHKRKLDAVRRRKAVVVNGVLFKSVAAAARAHGINPSSASYRISRGKNRGGKMGEWVWENEN